MGTPLPPNEPGILCAICSAPGKPFHDVATPRFISLFLDNLTPGEFWVQDDQSFLLSPPLLIQTLIPCEYSIIGTAFSYFVLWRNVGNLILVTHLESGKTAFRSFGDAPCKTEYANDNVDASGNYAIGGTGRITWLLEGLL